MELQKQIIAKVGSSVRFSPDDPITRQRLLWCVFKMGLTNVLRTIVTVKPHVPLIKFRKGGKVQDTNTVMSPSSGPPAVAAKAAAAKGKVYTRPVIEDYQLPAKYRRQPIDEKEIEYINRGGPE